MFEELTTEASFTRIEEEVWRFWRRHEVPEAFHAARQTGSPVILSQQPSYAAGEALIDQAQVLTVADVLVRYHAMRGDAIHRISGWVCHGLPVEVNVEQALGPGVASYDLVQFNDVCRQAATDGMRRGEALASRLAVWPAPGETFVSLEPQAIGLVWSALRRLWDAGRLKRTHRIVSTCPRCATPLSASEVGRRVEDTEAQSIWVRLPWEGEPDAYLLAWCPSPWMLAGMVALAVHPGAQYALVELPLSTETPAGSEEAKSGRLLVAEMALSRAVPGDYRVVRRLSGRALRNAHYHPPFTFLPAGKRGGQLVLSDKVPLDRGTGFWPVTPSFDDFSFALAQDHNLPVPELLDDWGAFDQVVTPWRGLRPRDAEPLLIEDLRVRGLLLRAEVAPHIQALCPHCETPVLPLARSVWEVETGSGPWIVSRDRAWGVPLPIWACTGCGEQICVAGLDDLARRAGQEAGEIDPHRPAVDMLTLPCESCQATMRRVHGVLDASFEAAVLSWATAPTNRPANIAVGLGDVHLGWLGDLTELAALLQSALAWEQAVALPERGPQGDWDLERMPSADAVRWAACAGTTPDEAEREFLRPLWRLAVSLLSAPEPEQGASPTALQQPEPGQDILDQWLEARLYKANYTLGQALDAQDPSQATRELAELLDDLAELFATRRPSDVNGALGLLCRLLAPFVPHLADAIHRRSAGWAVASVHLAAWPVADRRKANRKLLTQMTHAHRLVSLGQSARVQAGIAADQALRRAIAGPLRVDQEELPDIDQWAGLLAEMLGVDTVRFSAEAAALVNWRLAVEAAPQIDAVLAGLPFTKAEELAGQLRAGLSVALQLPEQTVTLLPDEVTISPQARPGWAAAADTEYLLVLEVG